MRPSLKNRRVRLYKRCVQILSNKIGSDAAAAGFFALIKEAEIRPLPSMQTIKIPWTS